MIAPTDSMFVSGATALTRALVSLHMVGIGSRSPSRKKIPIRVRIPPSIRHNVVAVPACPADAAVERLDRAVRRGFLVVCARGGVMRLRSLREEFPAEAREGERLRMNMVGGGVSGAGAAVMPGPDAYSPRQRLRAGGGGEDGGSDIGFVL